jgi:CIC family chloride channel protein
MGAAAGHLMGYFAQYWLPAGHVSSLGFYSMLGMGAMMSAVLQAPLAGLTALLELTGNLNLIVPAMFVIVVANLVAHSPPFGKNSLFIEQMRARGLDYAHNPIAQSLRRVGVIYAMDRRFTTAQQAQMSGSTAEWVLSRKPHWIIVEAEPQAWVLVRAADVARALSELGAPDEATDTVATLDLLAIPAQRLQVALIDRRATLQEALAQMQQQDLAALVVVAGLAPPYQFQGIVTREAIEHNYLGFKNTQ